MNIVSWLTINPSNLAEQICRATDYFEFPSPVTRIQNDCKPEDFRGSAVIFGGSGLFNNNAIWAIEMAIRSGSGPIILWGVGCNDHELHAPKWPEWVKRLDLVGLRDFGSPFRYVPCPTCMHKAFDAISEMPPEHDIVIYSHPSAPIRLPGIPSTINYHSAEEICDVLCFLASGRVILTSSYHGAYWGCLLNRTVLVWKPWSSKFFTLKPKLPYVNADTWKSEAANIQDHSGYLDECRNLNIEFHKDALKLLC